MEAPKNIKQFYLKNHPTDELGKEINPDATFAGLIETIKSGRNVYDFIGVDDSVVRERLFLKVCEIVDWKYKKLFNLWLDKANNQNP